MNDSSAAQQPTPSAGGSTQPNLTVLPPPSGRRSRMDLNRTQAGELTQAETICLAAKKPDYASVLSSRGITEEFVATLLADIATARTRSINAVQSTYSRISATNSQEVCSERLLQKLRVVQTAARQKYFVTDPPKLRDYYVGHRINASRAVLDQVSQAILEKAYADSLPGIDAEFMTALESARAAWKACTASQSTERSRAKTQRSERDAMVAAIQERRKQIQLAADAAWPWNMPENSGARGEFKLPRKRTFSV